MVWIFEALQYIGQVYALVVRVKASGFRGVVRVMAVIEDPTQPLSVSELQSRVADRGAIAVPGFSIGV